MPDRVRVSIPLQILDVLWPVPVPLWEIQREKRTYIAHLDRYVEMGVLSKSGEGSKDDPIRYYWLNLAPVGEPLLTKYDERLPLEHLARYLHIDDLPADLLARLEQGARERTHVPLHVVGDD